MLRDTTEHLWTNFNFIVEGENHCQSNRADKESYASLILA